MMRRRFGRRRWGVGGGGNGGDDGSGRSLDAAQELARVLQLGLVPADALEPVDGDEIPATLAVVGTGTSRDGEALVVGVAPSGGDAWLAALAVATRIEGFSGSVIAIAPSWSVAARRRLGLLRATPFGVHARLEAGEGAVEPEPLEAPLAAASVVLPEDALTRALFERATLALAGLAAKHGGATRAVAGAHEMVLLGRVAALLRADEGGVLLELREPRRELIRIASDGMADAFDRVEGSLRKFLGDRRMREGESGIRWTLATALPVGLALRRALHWPVGDALDLAGIDAQGRGVAAAVRGDFGLAALGPVLDAWAALQPRWPALFPEATDVAPALCIAAEQLAPAAARVLALIDADLRWMEASRRGREPSFLPRALPSAPESTRTEARPWAPPVSRAETPPEPVARAGAARAAGGRSRRVAGADCGACRSCGRGSGRPPPLRGALALRPRRGHDRGECRHGRAPPPPPPPRARSRRTRGGSRPRDRERRRRRRSRRRRAHGGSCGGGASRAGATAAARARRTPRAAGGAAGVAIGSARAIAIGSVRGRRRRSPRVRRPTRKLRTTERRKGSSSTRRSPSWPRCPRSRSSRRPTTKTKRKRAPRARSRACCAASASSGAARVSRRSIPSPRCARRRDRRAGAPRSSRTPTASRWRPPCCWRAICAWSRASGSIRRRS